MLQSLSIRNFVLIDQLECDFKDGLCVITGDTGSGKSILIDAILFCLGGKSTINLIRAGASSCSVTAIFTLNSRLKNFLQVKNISFEDQLIIKCQQISSSGKKYLINDQIVTLKTLEQITSYLLEIHGQHHQTILVNPAAHIDILDNYAGLTDLKLAVGAIYSDWQKIQRLINRHGQEKAAIITEISYLTFVVDELVNLKAQLGEEEQLVNQRRCLQNYHKDLQQMQDLQEQLAVPEIDQAISRALRIISRCSNQALNFSAISTHLETAYDSFEEARAALKSMISNFAVNKSSLEVIEDRLFELRGNARKYAVTSDQLPEFLAKSCRQLQSLQQKISVNTELEEALQLSLNQYLELAKTLSKQRKSSAACLESVVNAELALLKMAKAVFKVEITSSRSLCESDQLVSSLGLDSLAQNNAPNQLTKKGLDAVRFIAAINPGSSLAPLGQIASGGELSRFMLAIKTAILGATLIPTIIFDEIDTGTGGVVADSVGECLKKLSKSVQVIVITHQPQVAGKADQHILVTKTQLAESTVVIVKTLSDDQRLLEIARMISGKLITKNSRQAAKELLFFEE